ncbi:MAG: hypothetical protein M3R27_08305 [Bacteroidota bacterium]|nr:hypothetical protein [Bacteroidota bacterium]
MIQTSSISVLQKELKNADPKDVLEICIRLAKHKKENKELLHYLLFEAQEEKSYVASLKSEIDQLFYDINRQSAYTTKKGLQKTMRVINKFIKFSDVPSTEMEVRIYFCTKMRAARISLDSSSVISNIYYREVGKIKKMYEKLHEDLQYDYKEAIEKIS